MAKKKRAEKEADIPISAMIDIVFLLIIFFVVTAVMDKEMEDESVWMTFAPHGKPLKKKDPRAVTINVRIDGTINTAGRVVDMPTLTTILNNAATEFGNDIPVIIRGDQQALHGHVKRVMEAITQTGLYKVKFQATKDETERKK